MKVAQSVLDDCAETLRRQFDVEIDRVEHVGSAVPPPGQPPMIPPPALVRVDWGKGAESGWQLVELRGEEIYD